MLGYDNESPGASVGLAIWSIQVLYKSLVCIFPACQFRDFDITCSHWLLSSVAAHQAKAALFIRAFFASVSARVEEAENVFLVLACPWLSRIMRELQTGRVWQYDNNNRIE